MIVDWVRLQSYNEERLHERREACPRLCFVSDCSQERTLFLNCLLDGEAYVFSKS